jgi:hypothetical protein
MCETFPCGMLRDGEGEMLVEASGSREPEAADTGSKPVRFGNISIIREGLNMEAWESSSSLKYWVFM